MMKSTSLPGHLCGRFISVSISESVPTAMMEAMANHIFVVATEVDGVRDGQQPKRYVDAAGHHAAEQLKTVLEGLCRISKENIEKKSKAAYQYWQEHLNADINCDAFAAVASSRWNHQKKARLRTHLSKQGFENESEYGILNRITRLGKTGKQKRRFGAFTMSDGYLRAVKKIAYPAELWYNKRTANFSFHRTFFKDYSFRNF